MSHSSRADRGKSAAVNVRMLLAALFGISLSATASGLSSAAAAVAATPAETDIAFRSASFDFNRSGVPIPHWAIKTQADGSALYSATGLEASERAIRLGPGTLRKLVAALPTIRSGRCETKLKNIAKTGQKTLMYTAEDGSADHSCTFNFSDSEPVNLVTDAFIATAETLQAGQRLAQKHRYDRLGLDAEIDVLVEAVKNGRAIDVANIAPILQSIADDERLIERVQRKAARLLQNAATVPADNAR